MVSSFELSDNVVGILIESDVDDALINKIQDLISEKFEDHEEINLFLEIRKGNKVSFRAFLNQLKFHFNKTRRLNKIAIVTDLDWIKNSMIVKDVLLPTDFATFPNKDRLNALAWISE